MSARPTLVVFLGGLGSSPVERIVGNARAAASLDCIEAALASEAFAGAVVATDDASLNVEMASVTLDIGSGPFHLGRRLAGIIRKHALESIVYMSGGSIPLFAEGDFAAIAGKLYPDGVEATNNSYSSDLVAFRSNERVLALVEAVERDNTLASVLADGAGLTVEELPRGLTTMMDIDGPTDLAILFLTGLGGRHLRRYLHTLELEVERYRGILPLFTDRDAQIVVAGRVGSHAWQYLERETACRVRLFAEERGLEAEGRAQEGTARSLLGFFVEAVGLQRFFDALAQLGDAALIDTRVLLAHKRIETSREDRFLSDLGHWQKISEPFLRDFTRAADQAPIPVILGGHSLMSGALMALNEFAWSEHDLAADARR